MPGTMLPEPGLTAAHCTRRSSSQGPVGAGGARTQERRTRLCQLGVQLVGAQLFGKFEDKSAVNDEIRG